MILPLLGVHHIPDMLADLKVAPYLGIFNGPADHGVQWNIFFHTSFSIMETTLSEPAIRSSSMETKLRNRSLACTPRAGCLYGRTHVSQCQYTGRPAHNLLCSFAIPQECGAVSSFFYPQAIGVVVQALNSRSGFPRIMSVPARHIGSNGYR